MSVRIPTRDLVGLLTDLALTAADPANGGPRAGILLHTARGHSGDAPGKVDLLVGTSGDGTMIGHAHAACSGQIAPMLWPIGEVRAVLAVIKPLAKEKDHAVEITADGVKIAVAEDADLFGERLKLTFTGADPGDYPAQQAAERLSEIRVTPPEDSVPAAPRTDLQADKLAPFLKVAIRRGELVQVFRWHQRLPVVVQIGDSYRGLVAPSIWRDEDRAAGAAPGGDVYPLVLDAVAVMVT